MPSLTRFAVLFLVANASAQLVSAQSHALFEAGGAITSGARYSFNDRFTEGSSVPRTGWGWQLGALELFGEQEDRLNFLFGLRFQYRYYRQAREYGRTLLVQENGHLRAYGAAYDGVATIREARLGIPLQWWVRLGARSKLSIGYELSINQGGKSTETGERTISSTTNLPDGSHVTTYVTEPYTDELGTKSGRAMAEIALGYRRWFGSRCIAGLDASVVGPMNGKGLTGGPVSELSFNFGWLLKLKEKGAAGVKD